jgi:hypothetical protein
MAAGILPLIYRVNLVERGQIPLEGKEAVWEFRTMARTHPQAMDLVQRARDFAVTAHSNMNHRRKYTDAPYSTHLQNVVNLVAAVSDDAEILAGAWLHDVVEDTPTTLEEVEAGFGKSVARLVDCLTDVSRSSDGNRAVRKEIDRQHLARADAKAKTIKLADLIDNCRDICQHNRRFANVYLQEMAALLQVLSEGDPSLYGLAHKTHMQGLSTISRDPAFTDVSVVEASPAEHGFANQRLVDVFTHAFAAKDIAEPLLSLDIDNPTSEAHLIMGSQSINLMGLRDKGEICGYVRRSDLSAGTGTCRDHLRPFRPGQIIRDDSPLSELIEVLTRQEYAFISVIGVVGGYISRGHLNNPVTRMWLFGILTLFEMQMVRQIREYFPDESWRALVPKARLDKASMLEQERSRRNQHGTLLECLQFSDKGQILLQHPLGLKLLDIRSRAAAKRMIKSVESLRNNLAHGQDIVKYDWASIAGIAGRLEEASYRNKFGVLPWEDT